MVTECLARKGGGTEDQVNQVHDRLMHRVPKSARSRGYLPLSKIGVDAFGRPSCYRSARTAKFPACDRPVGEGDLGHVSRQGLRPPPSLPPLRGLSGPGTRPRNASGRRGVGFENHTRSGPMQLRLRLVLLTICLQRYAKVNPSVDVR